MESFIAAAPITISVPQIQLLTRKDGKFKGLAIVAFNNEQEADIAMGKLDGFEMEGRKISARKERTKEEAEKVENKPKTRSTSRNNGAKSQLVVEHGPADATTLYLANLSWSQTNESLRPIVEKFGPVSNVEIGVNPAGKPKGYALIKFATLQAADAALKGLNNTELDGRLLRVRFDIGARIVSEDSKVAVQAPQPGIQEDGDLQVARNRRGTRNATKDVDGVKAPLKTSTEPRAPRAPRAPRVEDNKPGYGVYVGNLSWSVSNEVLTSTFSPYGTILSAEVAVAVGSRGSRSKGFGIVKYQQEKSTVDAIAQLNDKELEGRKLVVRLDHNNQA